MKIYMDNCCFNRIFDDRSHPSIYFERNSVMIILELVEKAFWIRKKEMYINFRD